MKISKLSIIAILAISFGFFSCNEEDSLIIPQNSNGDSQIITEDSSVQTRIKYYYFRIEPSLVTISKDGGTSILYNTVSAYPNFSNGQNLINVTYTGSAPGFTLSNNKVTAAPMPPNTEGRSIKIYGSAPYDGTFVHAEVTVYQEGTATSAAKIGDTIYIGDKTIYLSPGTYECYAGYADGRFAKETWVTGVDGPGVWAEMPHGPIHVGPDADAVVTLQAILPRLPTSHLHIKAK